MYSVCVRDHFMIAHSFKGAVFGPAQALHGATFVVDVEFRRAELDEANIVVDIGRASEALKSELTALNYKNLDEDPSMAGQNTTTEYLSRYLHNRMADRARSGTLGAPADAIESIKVTLHESHIAWASYDGAL
ncbi:MAG: 6-carboxytetrahydropterin synthase [Pseudomonadota bacterium]